LDDLRFTETSRAETRFVTTISSGSPAKARADADALALTAEKSWGNRSQHPAAISPNPSALPAADPDLRHP